MSTEFESQIESRVDGIVTVITINRPDAYNAMNYYHYAALEEHLKQAADNPNTIVTLIQATGKFFSAGADVRGNGSEPNRKIPTDGLGWPDRRELQGRFTGRNAVIVDTFWNHPKVLIVALNGPVIGLTAALVSLADFIYARDSAYLLVPFANLSLVTEGAASFTLPARLGWSLANEALLAAKSITAADLARVGFVNKLYKSDSTSTEQFNSLVLAEAKNRFTDLDHNSVKLIKKLIHAPLDAELESTSAREIIGGLDRFSSGQPQARFAAIAAKARRHKL